MELKQRHGCVTAWLILMIIANSFTGIMYLFASDMITRALPRNTSQSLIILLGILGIANVIFSVLLFKWNKWGFWGFCATSVGALLINISIGLGVGQSLFGLAGVAVLYGVFQIKKDDISAWDNFD